MGGPPVELRAGPAACGPAVTGAEEDGGVVQRLGSGSWWSRLALVAVMAGGLAVWVGPAAHAAPPSVSSSLSSFDVVDSTDRVCHGFVIEIEDVASSDTTAQSANVHYGPPVSITSRLFPDGHPGIVVRYSAAYANGTWSAATPVGTAEHFGVELRKAPGTQRFTWLCEDPAGAGALVEYGGSTAGNLSPQPVVAQPTATVVATPTGEVVRHSLTNGVVDPAPALLPDAVWVRRYVASAARAPTLDQLVADGPVVARTRAVSMLPGRLELVAGGASLPADDPLAPTDAASVMVVDTFRYAGPYDGLHAPSCNAIPGDPNSCAATVGAQLATQMYSADIVPAGARATLDVAVLANGGGAGGTVSSGPIASAAPGPIDCGTACIAAVDAGTAVTLTATPAPGYTFVAWKGACTGTDPTCQLAVGRIARVAAVFAPVGPVVGGGQPGGPPGALAGGASSPSVAPHATRGGVADPPVALVSCGELLAEPCAAYPVGSPPVIGRARGAPRARGTSPAGGPWGDLPVRIGLAFLLAVAVSLVAAAWSRSTASRPPRRGLRLAGATVGALETLGIVTVVMVLLTFAWGGGPVPTATLAAGASASPGARPVTTAPSDASLVATARVPLVRVFDAPGAPTPSRGFENPWPVNRDPGLTVPLVFAVEQRSGGWVQVLLPTRPNGTTGWVPAADVTVTSTPYRVSVELGARRLTVYRGPTAVLRDTVAVGARRTPTPTGRFFLRALLRAPDARTIYGPYAYGLSGFSPTITEFNGGDGELGIHGNNDARALGRAVTHGCIRTSNRAIEALVGVLPLGVRVDIVP